MKKYRDPDLDNAIVVVLALSPEFVNIKCKRGIKSQLSWHHHGIADKPIDEDLQMHIDTKIFTHKPSPGGGGGIQVQSRLPVDVKERTHGRFD